MNSEPKDINQADVNQNNLWQTLCNETRQAIAAEPLMADYYQRLILNQDSFTSVLSHSLAMLLATPQVDAQALSELFNEVMAQDEAIADKAVQDISAHVERDPACDQYLTPLLYFKGFQALQVYRIAHRLWLNGRSTMAFYLQNRASEVFSVDIHPAAKIGSGIMIDHATGVVIGETSVVEDNVSMLHGVSLGGTGNATGDRHPKIRAGVLIAAGAKILGNIEVGEGAKIGAGSLVLDPVPAHTTVAGVPARVVGRPAAAEPSRDMDQQIESDDTEAEQTRRREGI